MNAARPRTGGKELREMREAFAAHRLETLEFGKRIIMIIDPEIKRRIRLGRVDTKRCGLPSALVAARRLTGLERMDQTLGKRQVYTLLIGAQGVVNHPRPDQHVAGYGDPFCDAVPAPRNAIGAGVGSDSPMRILKMYLPRGASGIGIGERSHHIMCSHPVAQHREGVQTIKRIDERLRGKGPDPALCMRAEGAHCKEAGGHRHPECTGGGVARND